jgi:hypothetical protein
MNKSAYTIADRIALLKQRGRIQGQDKTLTPWFTSDLDD